MGGTQFVYSGGDGGCQAQHHVILRLQSGAVLALQIGERGESTFTEVGSCKGKEAQHGLR